jgi:hypothetical protein
MEEWKIGRAEEWKIGCLGRGRQIHGSIRVQGICSLMRNKSRGLVVDGGTFSGKPSQGCWINIHGEEGQVGEVGIRSLQRLG